MDTECRIEWVDDGEQKDVIIRETEYDNDPDDESIFFYGLSRKQCIELMESKEEVGDFIIVAVY